MIRSRRQIRWAAGLNDPAATAKCFAAGEGRRLRLAMGATIEKRFGPPLEAEVEVVRLVANPRRVVGRIGEVEVILADGPTAFTDARQFEPCGLDPLSRKRVVVKEGYVFPGLTRIAPRNIMLLTPGAGDMPGLCSPRGRTLQRGELCAAAARKCGVKS